MSKKKTKKMRPVQKKKKSGKKFFIIALCAALTVVLLIAGGVVLDRLTNIKYVDFVGRRFESSSGYDATGDEIDLDAVYNVRYDNYHGSLTFKEDGTFSLWMTTGPDDGTNDGTFTYNRGDEFIYGEYNSGEKIKFKIVRGSGGMIERIEAPYKDYTIYFS